MIRVILSIIICLRCISAQAQNLFGIQLTPGYRINRLYNEFDETNKGGMYYISTYNRADVIGLNLYFMDKWNIGIDYAIDVTDQNFKYEFVTGSAVPFDNPKEIKQSYVQVVYSSFSASTCRLFGNYDKKFRPFAGAIISFNNLIDYTDKFSFTRPADATMATYQKIYNFHNETFENESSGFSVPFMTLSKWLYKKKEVRLGLNVGAQLQLNKHLFLLFGAKAQHSLTGIETSGPITASTTGNTTTITDLGLQQRYGSKYPSGASVSNEQRLAPTFMQAVGGYLGLRFQFGSIMQ
jgi:hypothetical protein